MLSALLLLSALFVPQTTTSLELEEIPTQVVEERPLTVHEIIDAKAKEYGVSAYVMHTVVACESGYDTKVQSKHITAQGTREQSFGLVQINTYWNPDVTYEQAIDPVFSADFLAKRLSEGKGYLWTCYRKHFGV